MYYTHLMLSSAAESWILQQVMDSMLNVTVPRLCELGAGKQSFHTRALLRGGAKYVVKKRRDRAVSHQSFFFKTVDGPTPVIF